MRIRGRQPAASGRTDRDFTLRDIGQDQEWTAAREIEIALGGTADVKPQAFHLAQREKLKIRAAEAETGGTEPADPPRQVSPLPLPSSVANHVAAPTDKKILSERSGAAAARSAIRPGRRIVKRYARLGRSARSGCTRAGRGTRMARPRPACPLSGPLAARAAVMARTHGLPPSRQKTPHASPGKRGWAASDRRGPQRPAAASERAQSNGAAGRSPACRRWTRA